jgi:hypothetical protein
LKSTSGLSGVIGTSLDYFIWEKLPYTEAKVGPFILDKAPADAKRGYYKVVVVGGTTILGLLPPSWVPENIYHNDYMAMQTLMGAVSVVKDYFLPVAFALSAKDTVNMLAGKELTEFCSVLLGLFIKSGVNVTQNIDAHDYDGAWQALYKAFLTDGELRKSVCKLVATWILKRALSAERLEQVSASAQLYAAILKGFDIAMLAYDIIGYVSKDLIKSNGYEYFDVIAVKPNIHIEPPAATVRAGTEKIFNALKGPVAGDTFEYRWAVTGGHGSLRTSDGETLASEQTTSSPTIHYRAANNAVHKGKDKLTVGVYRKMVTDSGVVTQFIGSDEAAITIENDPNGIPIQ